MTITQRLRTAVADRYLIERELGQGGMATVYLAQDVRHDRKVALKVLRAELSAILGSERFLHEIRTTAGLQHPHILALHDSGEIDGIIYYVMPYVEGESLRDRLNRERQLPVDDAVRIAREAADALDYAHRRGVVHRDIKPENMLLHDGHVVVADFGIALAVSSAGGSTRLTETGMSLGTPHYMAPEQAMGDRDITPRADVYALGCVLYEMLAGEPPFTGPTAQAIIARVMTETPRPLTIQRHTVPPQVEAVTLKALEKLPADRFATAAEMAEALARPAMATGVSPPGPAAPIGRTRWRRLLPWGVAASAVALALAGWLRPRPAGVDHPPSRLAILAPGLGGSGSPALQRQLALTPDGAGVIYVAVDPQGANQLMRQALDAPAPTVVPVSGLSSPASPLISPDGRWLAATTYSGRVVRVPLDGGAAVPLPAELSTAAYGAFDSRGNFWSSVRGRSSRFLARIGGGDTLVRVLEGRIEDDLVMQVLPDDRTALTVERQVGSATGLSRMLDLETGQVVPLLGTPVTEIRYTAGLLVYVLGDGTMQAAPFDARRRRLLGAGTTIATGVSLTGTGIAQFAVAPNGTVVYIPEEPRSLVLVDRAGAMREALAARHTFHAPMFSPDGLRLSIDITSAEGRDVWVLELGEGTFTRATFDRDGHDATWTPDGRYLTYTSAKSGALGIYRARPGSAEPPESLLASPTIAYTGHWLPDGAGLVTVTNALRPNSGTDLALVANGGRGPFQPLVATQFSEAFPALSPDGRWVAFVSDQSGQPQVYVRAVSSGGDLVQVSQQGGTEPLWSRDGRELYFRGTAEGRLDLIMASIRTTPGLAVTARRVLFPIPDIVGTQPHTNYDVSPDGRTFAMVRRSPATRIIVIQNLAALVARLRGAAGGSASVR